MKRWTRQLLIALAVLLCMPGWASAEWEQSTSYGMNESELGGNGCTNGAAGTARCGSSTSYKLDPNIDDGGSSLGESAIGNSASASYQTNSGINSTDEPGLSLCVGTSGFGCASMVGSSITFNPNPLTTISASTATAVFGVKDYTSSGYAVTISGADPTYAAHPLAGMGTQSANSTGCARSCASVAGSEQFGINLRSNSSPVSLGADPAPYPSSSFSVSNPSVIVALPYQTANQYRYFDGDTIAAAAQSSGETDYTISLMTNISTLTPGGTYKGALTVIVTGTF